MAGNGFGQDSVSPLRVFGAMLRYYRVKAGLSQIELGGRVHFSDDLISKIEMGQRTPTEEFTVACDAVPEMDTGGALTELREQLGDALKIKAYPGWFSRWPDKEAAATILRSFELVVVPGLLQTENYAQAVLRTRVKATDEEIQELVVARMERQAVLARAAPPMLWVIIYEAVLRCPVGSTKVMRDQLAYLAEMASRPSIVVQVIPLSVGAHEGFRGPFTIADFGDAPSVAYQDTAVRGQVIEDSDDLIALAVLWETLKSETLPRSASLRLLEEVAGQWT